MVRLILSKILLVSADGQCLCPGFPGCMKPVPLRSVPDYCADNLI